jgi:hypothetical protein
VGINGGGETVGFRIDGAGVQHGFTNVGGTFTSVDNPMTTTLTSSSASTTPALPLAIGPTPQEISVPSLFPVAHSPE